VHWKAEYSALSSTRSQKKKLKQPTPVQCPFNTVQVKIREVSPEGIRVTMEERSKQINNDTGLVLAAELKKHETCMHIA